MGIIRKEGQTLPAMIPSRVYMVFIPSPAAMGKARGKLISGQPGNKLEKELDKIESKI